MEDQQGKLGVSGNKALSISSNRAMLLMEEIGELETNYFDSSMTKKEAQQLKKKYLIMIQYFNVTRNKWKSQFYVKRYLLTVDWRD
jgi:hypothetical protein